MVKKVKKTQKVVSDSDGDDDVDVLDSSAFAQIDAEYSDDYGDEEEFDGDDD